MKSRLFILFIVLSSLSFSQCEFEIKGYTDIDTAYLYWIKDSVNGGELLIDLSDVAVTNKDSLINKIKNNELNSFVFSTTHMLAFVIVSDDYYAEYSSEEDFCNVEITDLYYLDNVVVKRIISSKGFVNFNINGAEFNKLGRYGYKVQPLNECLKVTSTFGLNFVIKKRE